MGEKKKKKKDKDRDRDNRDGEKKHRSSSKHGAHGDRDAKVHKSSKKER